MSWQSVRLDSIRAWSFATLMAGFSTGGALEDLAQEESPPKKVRTLSKRNTEEDLAVHICFTFLLTIPIIVFLLFFACV